MAKTIAKRQMDFRAKRKDEGGIRLDMWLPSEEAAKLKQLMVWRSKKSGAQVILDIINEAWRKEVPEAAQQGHADAQFAYGTFYAREYAAGQGNTRALLEAQSWFGESQEQEYRESAAWNNLGMVQLIFGDEEWAAWWFEHSADRGSSVGLYNRALLGMVGREVREPYYGPVAEWFGKSAEQGFSQAQEIVGILYAIGKGVPQNYEEALGWLRRAYGVREDLTYACEDLIARYLATYPDDDCDIRNGQLAITIAEKLVQLSPEIEFLYTLAEAYAETERFEDAIKTIRKIELRLQRGRRHKYQYAILRGCKRSLTSYMAKKPSRDASLTAIPGGC